MLGIEAVTIGAWAAVVTVVVYIVLAIYAARQLKEARTLREEQSRPQVIVEFVPDFIIGFRVKNIGATLARNVRVRWEKWPEQTTQYANDPVWKTPDGAAMFSTGIPSLAPGQEISTLFDNFPERVKAGLPMQYSLEVEYDNYAQTEKERRHYSERFNLDLDLFAELRYVKTKGIEDVVKHLEVIRRNTEKWTEFGGGGLKVAAYDRDKAKEVEYRPMKVTQARDAYRKGGLRALVRYVIRQVRRRHGLHFWGERPS